MPTPLPPNNSARYFLDYSCMGYGHVLQMRVDGAVTDSDASGILSAFLTVLDPVLYLITVDGFRFSQAGWTHSIPAVWSGDASFGTGGDAPALTAQYISFVGRDTDGYRARVEVFGSQLTSYGGDYRLSSSESTVVADAIAAMTADASMFWTVNQEVPIWHTYANLGINAYWRNKIR